MVYSKSGRDKGRMFVVVKLVNERFVLVADGEQRKIENPKLKNIKHLQWTRIKAEEVESYLARGEVPENHIIRKNLKRIQDRGEGGLVDG